MEPLTALPNIGPVLAQKLYAVGVDTPEALKRMGAEEAWLKIRLNVDSGACFHQLQALAGAVAGLPKKDIPAKRKAELKAFLIPISKGVFLCLK